MNYKEIDGKLVWEITRANQAEVALIALRIAHEADILGHHPDMLIHKWNHLRIELYSHDVNAITDRDYQLAEKIEALI
ncbi:MAG TPA: 4a-hydroxytetrahydrobiopterin dehydratase [Edaphocola sp.]|nr:4a-hydroxytetrahydrobiopterin dehydratase [Edaphocola sp.]